MARFGVTYWLGAADETEARARALDIALEQTVEIPRDIVPSGYVEDEILGRLEALAPAPGGGYLAKISYSDDDVGGDFVQLLNIVFGNSSLKTATRVVDLTPVATPSQNSAPARNSAPPASAPEPAFHTAR